MSQQPLGQHIETLVQEMGFTPGELDARKRFLEFGAEDERQLLRLHELMRDQVEPIVETLYRHLLGFDDVRSVFTGPDQVERAKRAQLRYFERFTQGPHDHDYAEGRLAIGAVHERLGVAAKYYLGSYCLYLREIARSVEAASLNGEERLAIQSSVLKLVFLDIGLAFDTYVFRREQELRAAIRELEAFNYSVSHDLRAPLRAIIGFSEALMEDASDGLDEESRSHLRFIVQGALRMAQLIEGLLKLSRLSRAEMQMQAVCVSEMASAAAVPLLAASGDRVDLRVQPGIWATGDERLVPALLQNLLDNAFKFTSHHPTALVEVGAVRRDGELVAYVRDDGAGFDMANADQLFGTFQRLHLETEFEGTGIGLATVMRIAHRHGGHVWAESAPEQGATFYFTLPDLRQD